MKKRRYFLSIMVISLLFVLSFSAISCKNDIQTMLDDYNTNFEPGPEPTHALNPGDKGFTAEGMLQSSYFVSTLGSINLAAPINCKTYKWTFYMQKTVKDPETHLDVEILVDITDYLDFYENSGKNKREFRAYVPNSTTDANEFLSEGTYKLELEVTDNKNKIYKDDCYVVLWKQI